MIRPSLLLAPLTLLLACAPTTGAPAPLRCPAGTTAMVREALYFGREIPSGGEVSDSAWEGFLAEVVTPAFPGGFTVLDGKGQWRGSDGKTISEGTLIFTIVHPATDDGEAKVLGIAERYRDIFRQEAVLHEHYAVCAQFVTGGV